MVVTKLLIEILETAGTDGALPVKVDSGAPKPFEECFKIVKDKGFLLFRPIKDIKKII